VDDAAPKEIVMGRKPRATSQRVIESVARMPMWHPLRAPYLRAFGLGLRMPDLQAATELSVNTLYKTTRPDSLPIYETAEKIIGAIEAMYPLEEGELDE